MASGHYYINIAVVKDIGHQRILGIKNGEKCSRNLSIFPTSESERQHW
jgi:hypothetical protein